MVCFGKWYYSWPAIVQELQVRIPKIPIGASPEEVHDILDLKRKPDFENLSDLPVMHQKIADLPNRSLENELIMIPSESWELTPNYWLDISYLADKKRKLHVQFVGIYDSSGNSVGKSFNHIILHDDDEATKQILKEWFD
ncbi:MAG: hypothetical protein COA78_03730 [Blastopirellula sp.]|nr:MAG: hypothetical protein COA78_03730 [Blastopirellula sp.]